MNALESEALASALSPAGRRVLLGPGGGWGGGHLGREGEEGLAVGWPLLPVCSSTSKPQCVRGPRILLSWAGWGPWLLERGHGAVCRVPGSRTVVLRGSKPSSGMHVPGPAVMLLCPWSALCPLPVQPLQIPVLIIVKRDLVNNKTSYDLSMEHLLKA